MTAYEHFASLHKQDSPLILANSWDVASAKLAEKNGFKAIATSSLAIAASLGYEDGENIPFDELLYMVKRIISNVSLPVTVDIESGYSDSIEGVVNNIDKLLELGVVGINLEDSKHNDLVGADYFSAKLQAIRLHLQEQDQHLFINARTDGYLLKISSPQEETLSRIRQYEAAGASGIFVPFVCDSNSIREITSAVSLPVNVLSMAGLPSFQELSSLGVRRVSLGSSLYRASYRHVDELLQQLQTERNVAGLFR